MRFYSFLLVYLKKIYILVKYILFLSLCNKVMLGIVFDVVRFVVLGLMNSGTGHNSRNALPEGDHLSSTRKY